MESQSSRNTGSVDAPKQLVRYRRPSCRKRYLPDSRSPRTHLPLASVPGSNDAMVNGSGLTRRGSATIMAATSGGAHHQRAALDALSFTAYPVLMTVAFKHSQIQILDRSYLLPFAVLSGERQPDCPRFYALFIISSDISSKAGCFTRSKSGCSGGPTPITKLSRVW